MSNLIKCPGCAAEIQFRVSSALVMVCPYCRNVVGRSDRGIETWGQFADVVSSESPLELGAGGTYQGKSFVLTGRLQLLHSGGGMWDEWYALFDDGRWGWLAEGQGRFYLTFRSGTAEHVVPPFSAGYQVVLDDNNGRPGPAEPGREDAPAARRTYTVTEVGKARIARGEGEIPFAFRPNDEVEYADLAGKDKRFATIDYTEDPPPLFLGREVTLAELGMAGRAAGRKETRAAAAVKVTCPECDGALELRAPDASLRVGCPFCGTLSDVKEGKLSRLQSLGKEKFPPTIKLGTTGELRGGTWTVIGFVRRSVRAGGVTYPWSEYLLHNPGAGFRWLVEADGHWSFVEPLAAGDIDEGVDAFRYQGKPFKLFQSDKARVDYVVGELYWKVEAGEEVHATDYVRPPLMVSREATLQEVTYSLGHYLEPKEVQAAFGAGIEGLSHPIGVAPHQPYRHAMVYKLAIVLLLVGIVAGGQACSCTRHRWAARQDFTLEPVEGADKTRVLFTEPFDLIGRSNVRVTLSSPVDNRWVHVQGDLVNEESGLVVPFSSTLEHYSGIDGGESWSEGKRTRSVYLAAVPRGRYVLRLEAQWSRWGQAETLHADVEQGIFRQRWLLILFGLLAVPPALIALHQYFFEKRRWSNSDFSPYESGEE